jgi:cbb3-type cytochrome oxidase subunit 3
MNYPEDTSDYQMTDVDSTFVDSLIRAGDYNYVNQNFKGKGLWESIKDFIFGWLREQGVFLGNWVENLILIIALLAFVIGILYLFSRYNRRMRDQLKRTTSPNLKEKDQEWNEDWVDKQLADAKTAHKWKEAVRWTYHSALIALNEADIIQRSEYKTAYDYQREITHLKLKERFDQLKVLHEKAWYDEVKILQSDVQKAEQLFQDMKSVLNETD